MIVIDVLGGRHLADRAQAPLPLDQQLHLIRSDPVLLGEPVMATTLPFASRAAQCPFRLVRLPQPTLKIIHGSAHDRGIVLFFL
ncbi:hypothetical protein [Actinoallomurus sp. NPDC050550]|uniref:hypothetical protein n=1 Tax=Actinoallomurus sp. NPDC050550 TaxID=3154937 RepID=UPI0033CA086D